MTLSLGWAATLLSGSFFISALLGLLRDRLLIANFGIGPTLDAYYIAFSVPDFIFYLLISGALSVTFIPVLTERLSHGKRKEAWELSSSLFNLLGLLTLLASLVIMVAAPLFVKLIASGLPVDVQDRAADLMRIVAINPFLFGIASVLASMQQATGRFFFNALAPVIYNIGIIIGIIFLAPEFGIKGVALGVALGAMAQLVVQGIGMLGVGFDYSWVINFKNTGLKKVLTTLPARAFDQSIDHVMAIFERFLASFLFLGAISSYQAAFTLRNVPITLIGAAIATAAFPKLSALAGKGAKAFRQDFIKILRLLLWLSMPAAAIAFIMRGYLVRLLLGSGSTVIALVLGWLSISIIFRVIFQISTRAFYAHQDTKTPLLTSIAALILNVVLSILLVRQYELSGLAMAQSLVAIFEVSLLLILLQRRLGKIIDLELVKATFGIALATGAMAIVTRILVVKGFPLLAEDTGFFALAPKFSLIVMFSAFAYLIASWLLRIKEMEPVTKFVTKLVFKPVKLPGQQ